MQQKDENYLEYMLITGVNTIKRREGLASVVFYLKYFK
jgi:hypothetical protein